MDILLKGGATAFFLIALFAGVIGLVGYKMALFYGRLRINAEYFLGYVIKLLDADNFSKAIALCDSVPNHPLGLVVKSALLKANKGDKEIERSMEQVATKVFPELTRYTPYIALLGNVSLLVGLAGTALGLVDACKAMGVADPVGRSAQLLDGMSRSLGNTALGLFVAIGSYVGYVVVRSAEKKLVDAIDHSAVTVLNYLSARNAKLQQKK